MADGGRDRVVTAAGPMMRSPHVRRRGPATWTARRGARCARCARPKARARAGRLRGGVSASVGARRAKRDTGWE